VPDRVDVARRICQCARLRGDFTLRSGQRTDTYFDKYQFESDPRLLRDIVELAAPLVPPGTDVLAGLEMGGIPVVTALSQATGLPAAFIRKAPKSYGTARYAEGPDLAKRTVLLVEDVVSSGGAILDAVTRLRHDGVEPLAALCIIDRETGGTEALAAAGIALMSLFTMTDIAAERNPD
jgi:orotate phosphoribosyltransferase